MKIVPDHLSVSKQTKLLVYNNITNFKASKVEKFDNKHEPNIYNISTQFCTSLARHPFSRTESKMLSLKDVISSLSS